MLSRLIHFFVLFAYINVSVYESNPLNDHGNSHLFDGNSVMEYVLVNLLDVSNEENEVNVEIQNENYRPFSHFQNIFPAILFIFLIHCFKQIIGKVKISHPFYQAKSVCLPFYYLHLFRFKPF